MRDQYMRCGEGFIICYSVTDRRSFQEASEYRKLIGRVRLTQDIPLVLIANKLDLQHQRTVTTEEGRSLALEFGCPFYETSACLRHYIDDVFYTLVREIRKKENKRVSVTVRSLDNSCSLILRGSIPLLLYRNRIHCRTVPAQSVSKRRYTRSAADGGASGRFSRWSSGGSGISTKVLYLNVSVGVWCSRQYRS